MYYINIYYTFIIVFFERSIIIHFYVIQRNNEIYNVYDVKDVKMIILLNVIL